jgi:hypothetical protein
VLQRHGGIFYVLDRVIGVDDKNHARAAAFAHHRGPNASGHKPVVKKDGAAGVRRSDRLHGK